MRRLFAGLTVLVILLAGFPPNVSAAIPVSNWETRCCSKDITIS